MPAKLDDASNLRFLYACMAHSNYTAINYDRVAGLFGIKGPAARMRFTRLKEQLDPGQRIGHKHVKISKAEARRRRQKDKIKQATKEGYEVSWNWPRGDEYEAIADEAEDDDEETEGTKQEEPFAEVDEEHVISRKLRARKPPSCSPHPARSMGDLNRDPQRVNAGRAHTQQHYKEIGADPSVVDGPQYPLPIPHMVHWSHPYYTPPPPPGSTILNKEETAAQASRNPIFHKNSMASEQPCIPGDAFEFIKTEAVTSSRVNCELEHKEPCQRISIEVAEAEWEIDSARSSIGSVIHVSMRGADRGKR